MVIIIFFDQLIDGFWQCWLFWTSWFFSTNGVVPDQFERFWSVLWVETMLLVLLIVFCFFSSCPWFWTSWLFLTFAMVSDQFDWYWFRPCCWLDWWFLTFLTMLMVFDHVDGSGPVDCFRPMGWFLTILNGFDQCYGFTPCCWSYLWIFFLFWQCWWFFTVLWFWTSWLFSTNAMVSEQFERFWSVLWVKTLLLVILVVFVFFWPCWWSCTSWLFSTNAMVPDQFDWYWSVLWFQTMLLVILVVFDFFDRWWVLTMSMVLDQLIVFYQLDVFSISVIFQTVMLRDKCIAS